MGLQNQPCIEEIVQGKILENKKIAEALFCLLGFHRSYECPAQRPFTDFQQAQDLEGAKSFPQGSFAHTETIHQFAV